MQERNDSPKLKAHMSVDRYGDFVLTDAIRPSMDLQVIPQQGYRCGVHTQKGRHEEIPILMASVSREKLWECFLDLFDEVAGNAEMVDVVLETSHSMNNGEHKDWYREKIDPVVLKSFLCDHEQVLLHDGCTGIAIISTDEPTEVQFDEHKLLIVYARKKYMGRFKHVMACNGIEQKQDIKFIAEGEHMHSTEPWSEDHFERMCYQLGARSLALRVTNEEDGGDGS